MAKSYDFRHAPGHLIRRAHQVSWALFMEETAGFDVTPVQFAILSALLEDPGEDQVTLARKVAFDPATFGSVIARLEGRGWVRREADTADRRRKLLWVTAEGAEVAQKMRRAVAKVQQRILEPLSPGDREQLVHLLGKLVDGHEGVDGADA
ncbi:MarR family transcriptional regulator [Ramlibacter sp. USB13]|uniref:MarR family transcriptional regulator n=1 Tax=Ramlibacter cellulosilyticus TaxID=2764187 RepID=A0A923MU69_9BURK|nr:MarR family transcriptional regulator [Ramlibacter cellulosilyticus]MBC5785942.1 MarR family transcriptional regulator [Ramlibacter cellulosilyticus]